MKNILVIEDNENMLRMMNDLLNRSGYHVLSAIDGVAGLKTYRAERPDLVITDIIMPDKEGLEVIMELVKEDPRPKIIAMSGGGMMEPRTYLSLAQKLGADEVLEKPFRPADLLTLIEKLLS
ncbi:MAG: response regulator [Pseudomonadota bacterium]